MGEPPQLFTVKLFAYKFVMSPFSHEQCLCFRFLSLISGCLELVPVARGCWAAAMTSSIYCPAIASCCCRCLVFLNTCAFWHIAVWYLCMCMSAMTAYFAINVTSYTEAILFVVLILCDIRRNASVSPTHTSANLSWGKISPQVVIKGPVRSGLLASL